MGAEVRDDENARRTATLIQRICTQSDVKPSGLVLYSDNGKPMRGRTMISHPTVARHLRSAFLAQRGEHNLLPVSRDFTRENWRRRPDLNRGSRFCRAIPGCSCGIEGLSYRSKNPNCPIVYVDRWIALIVDTVG